MPRKATLTQLRERLTARRDALRKALNGDLESLRAYHSKYGMGDDGDAANDHAHEEITSQLLEIEVRELEQIERALRRFAEGVYGRCEVCGGKIGEARINALPYVTHCIDCQREAERHGGGRRHREDISRWAQLYDTEVRSRETEVKLSDYETDSSESSCR